jgi:predicted phage replisome organizer
MIINWLKLDTDILNDNKIKIIRKYPAGDSLLVLWIGLLCLAMKSEQPGYIYITHGIPYSPKELANEFDIEEKTVEMGLQLFKQFRMIEVIEGGMIEIVNFNKRQDLEVIEFRKEQNRLRQQKYRSKQRNALLTHNETVTNDIREDIEKIREDERRIISETEAYKLTELFFNDLMTINNPTRYNKNKPDLITWSDHLRLLNERDGVLYKDMQPVWLWAMKDSFWKGNILSTEKFRIQFDALKSQMNRSNDKQNKETPVKKPSDNYKNVPII